MIPVQTQVNVPGLTAIDIQNLLNLLGRSQYGGIEEAEVGVVLKQKLQRALAVAAQSVDKPEPAKPVRKKRAKKGAKKDGSDVSSNAKSGAK